MQNEHASAPRGPLSTLIAQTPGGELLRLRIGHILGEVEARTAGEPRPLTEARILEVIQQVISEPGE